MLWGSESLRGTASLWGARVLWGAGLPWCAGPLWGTGAPCGAPGGLSSCPPPSPQPPSSCSSSQRSVAVGGGGRPGGLCGGGDSVAGGSSSHGVPPGSPLSCTGVWGLSSCSPPTCVRSSLLSWCCALKPWKESRRTAGSHVHRSTQTAPRGGAQPSTLSGLEENTNSTAASGGKRSSLHARSSSSLPSRSRSPCSSPVWNCARNTERRPGPQRW